MHQTGWNEGDLDMGKVCNPTDAACWEQKGQDAMKDHKYWTAAHDFKKAAEAADLNGDREGAAKDYNRVANALNSAGDLKGAAHYLEEAGDMSNDPIYYAVAGDDRMSLGNAAGRDHKDHKEAAKQYKQAKEDYTNAANAERDIGDNWNADRFDKLAVDAGKKEANEKKLVKPEHGGLPHHKNPRNYP
jgi:tetratricopeptide (TPR) repeat protein